MSKAQLEQRLAQLENEGMYAPLSPKEYAANLSERVTIEEELGLWNLDTNIAELKTH